MFKFLLVFLLMPFVTQAVDCQVVFAGLNLLEKSDEGAKSILRDATKQALEMKSADVNEYHVMLAIIKKRGRLASRLSEQGINETDLQLFLLQQAQAQPSVTGAAVHRTVNQNLTERLGKLASAHGGTLTEDELFEAIMQNPRFANEMDRFGISANMMTRTASASNVADVLAIPKERVLGFKEAAKTQVLDQEEAVEVMYRALLRSAAGTRDPKRPRGVFLFLGPSGTGKTETAKSFAKEVIGDERALLRLDMSEYMEKHTASRLLGSPPGYVGYEQGSALGRHIKFHPRHNMILFDEIEKAHEDVRQMLLGLLDEGRLTDGQNVTHDFTKSWIALTSNVGSDFIARNAGQMSDTQLREAVIDLLKQRGFSPEFINRIDNIVIFKPLSQETTKKIAGKFIQQLQTRLSSRFPAIQITDGALSEIAKRGYNPEFGAREMRRTVETLIESEIAERIVMGQLVEGTPIRIDFDKSAGKFIFGQ